MRATTATPLVALFLVACAQGVDGQESSPPGGGGGGAGGGGAGGAPACAMDCASIQTDACYVSRCDAATGNCEVVAAEDGTACDDGLFCTSDDVCQAGACQGGPANDCDITAGSCEVVTCDENDKACSTTAAPNGITCVAEDLCQLGPKCSNGQCLGDPNDCFFSPVPDDCHEAVCNPSSGLCEPTPLPDGQSCYDVNEPCTVAKTCTAGVCLGGEPKDCSFIDSGCLIGACDPMTGQCVQQPGLVGQSCEAPGSACTTGVCDVNANCVPQSLPNGSPCNDGDPCTDGDTCQSNLCNGSINPQCHKINAAFRGWWTNIGQHGLSGNTFTGQGQNGQTYNSYFDYDLSSLADTVITAELVFELESFWGPDAFEIASIWDVSTPHQTLVASTFDPAVAQDLQSGMSYATFTAQPSDTGSRVSIPLAPQAVADINANLGGTFAVGVHIDTAQTMGEQGLGFSVMQEPHIHWLVVTTQ